MQATALNKKKDRVLQKTFGTLNLEMNFTCYVLSLRVRTVKANFKRLRDRVDKLKSNLTPEEIKALRQMEEEGKLKTTSTFNLNAAMKIAAAARKLNLVIYIVSLNVLHNDVCWDLLQERRFET